MNLSECLRILAAKWVYILVCALIGFAAAFGLSRASTPIYTSSASVYFAPQSVESGNDLAQGANFTRDQMQSYTTLATEPVVLDAVIQEVGLSTTASSLATKIEASSPRNTVVLRIEAKDSDPDRAARIANATVKHLGEASSRLAPTSRGKSTIKATPVAVATPPEHPSSPQTRRNAAAGLLAGLFLGVLVALGLGLLDSRIRSTADLAKTTGVPLLGEIPLSRSRAGQARAAFARPESADANAYRLLMTNVAALSSSPRTRTVGITSSLEGEGKTVTAINLAVVAAETGNRVLLIDANLRNPRIAAYTGLPDRQGLSDVLSNGSPVADVVQPLIPGALDVLTSGAVPEHPSALLGSPAMRSLLDYVADEYDLVFIDTPATLTTPDPLLLTPEFSGVIVVGSAGRIRRPELRSTLAGLRQVEASIIGVVLNQSRRGQVAARWEKIWHRRAGRTPAAKATFEPLLTNEHRTSSAPEAEVAQDSAPATTNEPQPPTPTKDAPQSSASTKDAPQSPASTKDAPQSAPTQNGPQPAAPTQNGPQPAAPTQKEPQPAPTTNEPQPPAPTTSEPPPAPTKDGPQSSGSAEPSMTASPKPDVVNARR